MVAPRKRLELFLICVFGCATAVALLTYVSFAFPDLNDGFLNRRVTVIQWRQRHLAEEAERLDVQHSVVVTPLHLSNATKDDTKNKTRTAWDKHSGVYVNRATTVETVFAVRDLLWFAVTVILVAMTLWSYAAVATTDPGRVPADFALSAPGSVDLALALGNMDVCVPCDLLKPPRAHHCSRCGFCVLKYDHHCPWIAQCVGYFNYKLYLVFIFYAWMLSLLVTVSLSHAVYIYLLDTVHGLSAEGSTLSDWSNQTADLVRKTPPLPIGSAAIGSGSVTWPVALTWLYSFVLQTLLSYLVLKHRRLSRHNATTLDEVQYGVCTDHTNEFDLGEARNLADVYGDGDLFQPAGDSDDDGGDTDLEACATRRVPLTRWQRAVRFALRMLPIPAYSPDAVHPSPSRPDPSADDDGSATENSSLVMSPRGAKLYGTLAKQRAVAADATFDTADTHHHHRHRHHTQANDAQEGPEGDEHRRHHHHHHQHSDRHPAMRELRRGTTFQRNSFIQS